MMVYKIFVLGFLLATVYGQQNSSVEVDTVSILETPFLEMKDDYHSFRDLHKYEGYIADILKKLTNALKYEFKLTTVDRYGSPQPDGSWSGMIGKLEEGKADMAAAAITVTEKRSKVVNFSTPFLNTGLTIMMLREDVFPQSSRMHNLAYFFSPFTVGSWLLLVLAYIVVSSILCVYLYFHPYENGKMAKRRGTPSIDLGDAVKESFWFTLSTVALQGYRKPPQSLAARTLAAFWFFFVIILVASYIAGLVYMYSTGIEEKPKVTKLTDLIKRKDEFRVGIVEGGSTDSFFKKSTNKTYEEIQKLISSDSENYALSIRDAINKVKVGGYAFIGEGSAIEYATTHDCDLVQVGDFFEKRQYAFAFNPKFDKAETINNTLNTMEKNGELERLNKHWFHGGKCTNTVIESIPDSENEEEDVVLKTRYGVPISIDVFGGPLVALLIGILLSITVAVFEIVHYKLKGESRGPKAPFKAMEENSNEMEAKS